MHPDLVKWLSGLAMQAIRGGGDLPEQVAYELGGKPFIDPMRGLVTSGDKPRLLELIGHHSWWHRYLGTNLSRPVLDQEIATAVHDRYKGEAHFHTKLAMVYLMLAAKKKPIAFGAAEGDVDRWLADLESNPDELVRCIDHFYSPGNPAGTWDSLLERWGQEAFAGARALYLLSLALLADRGRTGALPDRLDEAAKDPQLAPYVARLRAALAANLAAPRVGR